jgi:hypothetical protein
MKEVKCSILSPKFEDPFFQHCNFDREGEAKERMKKIWLAGMALALAVGSPALAGTRHHSVSHWSDDGGDGGGGDDSFSAATLNGTYVFEASGFADDTKPGEVAVLGTLTFDGIGAVSGNLILTRGDSAQNSCPDTFTTGTYSFTGGPSAPGLFTMQIPMTAGSINFGLLVPSSDGGKALAIESDNGLLVGVTVCGVPGITSMVLKGKLRRLDGGGSGD